MDGTESQINFDASVTLLVCQWLWIGQLTGAISRKVSVTEAMCFFKAHRCD
jgi:hypothetical protein